MEALVRPLGASVGRRLYEFLVENGYCERVLQKTLGIAKPPLQQFGLLDRLIDETERASAFNLLVRWFFLSRPVEIETARSTLPTWFLEVCTDHGLLVRQDDSLAASCVVAPHDDLLVASDLFTKLRSSDPYDHVLSINPAAFNLLHFTIRQPVDTLLDLGAGCGIQAFAAARHCKQVVATDLNPRAARYLEFNATLNGIENVEILIGDLFEPVAGRTFDRIVSNPPFVIAPSKRFVYRDNDMELDGFCRRLVKEVPAYLNEGGIFQMICEWVEMKGQDWSERITEWFEGTGCDVLVMKGNTQEPSGYAEGRIRETLPDTDEAASAEFAEWMDYYRRMRVRAIHGGMVTMRRKDGDPWIRVEDRAGRVDGPFGEYVLTGLAIRDFLASHPTDESMLEATPRLLPRAMLETQYHWGGQQWESPAMRLASSDGLHQTIGLEGDVGGFLKKFDGTRKLGDLIGELTATVDVESSRVRAECVSMVRLLMERGFVSA
jgi:protein-L-isoaspartate O-methyltransferase